MPEEKNLSRDEVEELFDYIFNYKNAPTDDRVRDLYTKFLKMGYVVTWIPTIYAPMKERKTMRKMK